MYCSLFVVRNNNTNTNNNNNNNNNTSNYNMEHVNNFQGDLTDIVRGSGGANISSGSAASYEELGAVLVKNDNKDDNPNNWQFPNISDPINFSSSTSSVMEELDHSSGLFGNPFSNMRDPLLDVNFNDDGSTGVGFGSSSSVGLGPSSSSILSSSSSSSSAADHHQDMKMMSRPSCNIFSRMLQINPSCSSGTASSQCDSAPPPPPPLPLPAQPMAGAAPRGINVNGLVDNTGGLQISSPRNPGIKRRKSQAKKVVCIPAPAAANSRASGEVVPSDLWAWRKYGQKPIKGSPYPRGYYRCSSSKGCSARKQVERSRTDPNMLVITYTSEHNHPWPTQRNALAGSTRSQPSKSNNNNLASSNKINSSSSSISSPLSSQQQQHHKNTSTITTTSPKEQEDQQIIINKDQIMMAITKNDNNASPVFAAAGSTTSTTSASVKEEIDQYDEHDIEKQLEQQLDDSAFSTTTTITTSEVGFPYRPSMPSSDQDFFADLGEIEADPLNLLFSSTSGGSFSSSAIVDHDHHQHKGMIISKGLDPFNLFDWSTGGEEGGGEDHTNK